MRKLLLLACIFSLAACGGGSGADGKGVSGKITTAVAFHAINFTTDRDYTVMADQAGEGQYCSVYLEQGQTVNENDIRDIIDNFDNIIYPRIRAAYGEEQPDVNGDSKIYILLLDIKDDYPSVNAYISGYFDPVDLYPSLSNSNGKKILYMDVYPGLYNAPRYYPGNPDPNFIDTLAHEFQHLIHHNIKSADKIWLNEAMSEIAPFYAFNKPDWLRVRTFETGDYHSDSLTDWGGYLPDYAVVYMWAQYMADRFPNDVFRNILAVPNKIGIDSVEEYLVSLGQGIDFASVFRDWSIAIFFGDNTTVFTDNAVWTYKTITTWPSVYNGLQGLYGPDNLNHAGPRSFGPWSLGYSWYDNTSTPLNWSRGPSSTLSASIYDRSLTGGLTFDMIPDKPYPFDNTAYLIQQNARDVGDAGSVYWSISSLGPPFLQAETTDTLPTASEKLRAFAAAANPAVQTRGAATASAPATPVPVCVHDILLRREKIK